MKLLTIDEIWNDFDTLLKLEFEKNSDQISNGVSYHDFYFNGYKAIENSGIVRAHAVLATKANDTSKRPTIVVVHGIFDSFIQKNWLQHFVEMGFNALWIDLFSTAGIGTTYPENLAYCEKELCKDHIDKIEIDAIHSPWIAWSSIIRRGIKASLIYEEVDKDNIGIIGGFDSSNIVWHVLAMEERVRCGALLFNTSFFDQLETNKFETRTETLSDSDQMYLAGIASEAYASRVNKPVFIQTATNATYSDIDRSYELLNRTRGNKMIFVDANSVQLLPSDAIEKARRYFSRVFNKEELPKAPEITFEQQGKNDLKVIVSLPKDAEKPRVYYSVGESNPFTRYYNVVYLREENSRLVGDIKVYDDDSLVVAFASANIDDIRVSSKIISIKADKNTDKNSLVFSHGMNKKTFTAMCSDNTFEQAEISSFVKRVEGPKGIKGIQCAKPFSSLATFKIFSSSIIVGNNLVIDVNSPEKQTIKIVIVQNYADDNERKYSASVEIIGGEEWDRITLSASDFTDESGKALETFKDNELSLTYFETSYPIIINKILFL